MKMRINIARQGIMFIDARIDWLSAYLSRPASCHALRTGDSRYSITERVPSKISAFDCTPATSIKHWPLISSGRAFSVTSG